MDDISIYSMDVLHKSRCVGWLRNPNTPDTVVGSEISWRMVMSSRWNSGEKCFVWFRWKNLNLEKLKVSSSRVDYGESSVSTLALHGFSGVVPAVSFLRR